MAEDKTGDQPAATGKHRYVVDLDDGEKAVLERLAAEQQVSPERVFILGLRHYQALVHAVDIMSKLPPDPAEAADPQS